MSDPVMPRLLIMHQDAPMLLMLKREFEDSGLAHTIGARNPAAALSRLMKDDKPIGAIVLNWHLPKSAAPRFAAQFQLDAPDPKPFLLAFSPTWGRDDLRRGLQLGLDGFFNAPLAPRSLMNELRLLQTTGHGMTRARLLKKAGEHVFAPDHGDWRFDHDAKWARRMFEAAEHVHERWNVRIEEQVDRLEKRFERVLNEHPDSEMMSAIVLAYGADKAHVTNVAIQSGVDLRTLRSCLSVIHRRNTAQIERELLAPETRIALARLRKRLSAPAPDRASRRQVSELKRYAKDVVEDDGARGEYSSMQLMGLLKDQLHIGDLDLENLDQDDVRHIATKLLDEKDYRRAFDHVRLTVLAKILPEGSDDIPVDPGLIMTLASILGAGDSSGESAQRLMQAATELDPGSPAREFSFQRLASVSDALSEIASDDIFDADELGGVSVSQIHDALERLVVADTAGGEMDQMRMRSLADAWETGEEHAVGGRTLDALRHALEDPDESSDASHLNEVFNRMGTQDPKARARMHGLIASIRERKTKDAVDIGHLKRMFGEPTVDPGPPDFGDGPIGPELGEYDDLGAEGAIDDELDDPQRLAAIKAEFAQFGDALPNVDLDRIRDEVPPVELDDIKLDADTLARVRLFSALLGRCKTDEARQHLLAPFLAGYADRPLVAAALLEHLRHIRARDSVRCLRSRLELGGELAIHTEVEKLLDDGEVETAWFASADLADEHRRTPAVLNRVALAQQSVGNSSASDAAFTRCLRLRPGRAHLLFNHARLKIEMNQLEDATDLLHKAVRAAPDLGAARRLLVSLESRSSSSASEGEITDANVEKSQTTAS